MPLPPHGISKSPCLSRIIQESQAPQCKFVDIGVGVECEEGTWIESQGIDKHRARCVVFRNRLTLGFRLSQLLFFFCLGGGV